MKSLFWPFKVFGTLPEDTERWMSDPRTAAPCFMSQFQDVPRCSEKKLHEKKMYDYVHYLCLWICHLNVYGEGERWRGWKWFSDTSLSESWIALTRTSCRTHGRTDMMMMMIIIIRTIKAGRQAARGSADILHKNDFRKVPPCPASSAPGWVNSPPQLKIPHKCHEISNWAGRDPVTCGVPQPHSSCFETEEGQSRKNRWVNNKLTCKPPCVKY